MRLRTPRTWGVPLLLWAGLLLAGLLAGGCGAGSRSALAAVPGGDVERGAEALRSYGCGACHTIPGIAGANALVGPPLTDWSKRHYIAGTLPNTPENMLRWLQSPQAIRPGTAMPTLGVTEEDARDISAYLYSLGRN